MKSQICQFVVQHMSKDSKAGAVEQMLTRAAKKHWPHGPGRAANQGAIAKSSSRKRKASEVAMTGEDYDEFDPSYNPGNFTTSRTRYNNKKTRTDSFVGTSAPVSRTTKTGNTRGRPSTRNTNKSMMAGQTAGDEADAEIFPQINLLQQYMPDMEDSTDAHMSAMTGENNMADSYYLNSIQSSSTLPSQSPAQGQVQADLAGYSTGPSHMNTLANSPSYGQNSDVFNFNSSSSSFMNDDATLASDLSSNTQNFTQHDFTAAAQPVSNSISPFDMNLAVNNQAHLQMQLLNVGSHPVNQIGGQSNGHMGINVQVANANCHNATGGQEPEPIPYGPEFMARMLKSKRIPGVANAPSTPQQANMKNNLTNLRNSATPKVGPGYLSTPSQTASGSGGFRTAQTVAQTPRRTSMMNMANVAAPSRHLFVATAPQQFKRADTPVQSIETEPHSSHFMNTNLNQAHGFNMYNGTVNPTLLQYQLSSVEDTGPLDYSYDVFDNSSDMNLFGQS